MKGEGSEENRRREERRKGKIGVREWEISKKICKRSK